MTPTALMTDRRVTLSPDRRGITVGKKKGRGSGGIAPQVLRRKAPPEGDEVAARIGLEAIG